MNEIIKHKLEARRTAEGLITETRDLEIKLFRCYVNLYGQKKALELLEDIKKDCFKALDGFKNAVSIIYLGSFKESKIPELEKILVRYKKELIKEVYK